MQYEEEFLTPAEEQALAESIAALTFQNFEMHGVVAKRRVAHFGLDYAYNSRAVKPGLELPDYLLSLREKVGAWTQEEPERFEEVLVTEYQSGAGIGWHRDAPQFGMVAGVSLLAACRFKLRPLREAGGPPMELTLAPRSVYSLAGSVRWQWQHHIPATKALRYSVTFRTLR
jgi:alkylated DNA repair dioxygenase AlkB